MVEVSGSNPLRPIIGDSMEKDVAGRYREIYGQLKEQVKSIEEELENMEESGEADNYPVKHQKARDKIDEINEQLSELEKAFKELGDSEN